MLKLAGYALHGPQNFSGPLTKFQNCSLFLESEISNFVRGPEKFCAPSWVGLEGSRNNYPRNTNWIGPLRKNRLIPVFLVHEFAAGEAYPFIGVFELAPLRGRKRAITGGRFSLHQPMETSIGSDLRTSGLPEPGFFRE